MTQTKIPSQISSPKTSQFLILGGGISGLSLGWFLRQRHPSATITIIEKSSRVGGWIQTTQCNGFFFEAGPRSCRSHGSGIATLELIEALGIQDQWMPASPAAKDRFIYTKGKLENLPNGLLSCLTSSLMRPLLPSFFKEWRVPGSSLADETIYDFIARRLDRRVAETLFDPLTSGIYAGDVQKLSMSACFPEIYQYEQKSGSLTKGLLSHLFRKNTLTDLSPFVIQALKTSIFTLKDGMETIIKELHARLINSVQLNTKAIALRQNNKYIEVDIEENFAGNDHIRDDHQAHQKNRTLHADQVYLALPAHEINQLLNPIITKKLPTNCASAAVVNIGWKNNVLNRNGFGYLIPSKENEQLLGVVWDSSAFPKQNNSLTETRLTAMLGGTTQPNIPKMTRDEIIAITLKSIQKHLNISQLPDAISVSIANNAIPQYQLGHLAKINEVKSALKRSTNDHIHILGSAVHGVSVNDCIANAKNLISRT